MADDTVLIKNPTKQKEIIRQDKIIKCFGIEATGETGLDDQGNQVPKYRMVPPSSVVTKTWYDDGSFEEEEVPIED